MSGIDAPIFLGGLSRSGKTQLRIALEAHPELVLTRRTDLWSRYFDRFGDLGRPRNSERCLAALMADERVAQLRPDECRLRSEFREGLPSYARLFGMLHAHHALRLGRRRWGEQLGFVERFADPIFAAYPAAKMIQLVRDPRSRYEASAGDGRGRPGAVGWDTARWVRSAELAQRNLRRYPGGYLVVRYESLSSQPIVTLRQVCDFLEEPLTFEMTEALKAARFDDVDPRPAEDLRGTSLDGRGARSFIDTYARRQLAALGYPSLGPNLGPRERVSFFLADRPVDRAAMAAWRLASARKPMGQGG
jgi:hypothetical protein